MCWAGGEIEAGTKAGPFLALRTPPDRERGGKGNEYFNGPRWWSLYPRSAAAVEELEEDIFQMLDPTVSPDGTWGKKVKLDRWLRWWFGSTAAVLGS